MEGLAVAVGKYERAEALWGTTSLHLSRLHCPNTK